MWLTRRELIRERDRLEAALDDIKQTVAEIYLSRRCGDRGCVFGHSGDAATASNRGWCQHFEREDFELTREMVDLYEDLMSVELMATTERNAAQT